MIEGLKIQIESDELQAHLNDRVAYHEAKMEFYGDQVASLKAGGIAGLMQSNDPVASLQASAKQHRDRATFFRFVADHLIPNETYVVDESDLGRLEIASRYYG